MLSVRNRDSAIAKYVRARAATSETCEYLSTRIRNWLRASAKRPLTNSLCARSNAPRAADSSIVGCLGGGGAEGVGLTALTAASFCVFLTLETVGFLAAVFRTAGFGAGRRVLVFTFGLAAGLRATALRAALAATGLAAAARLAFALTAEAFALTARFAVFAGAFFAFERVGDRRKPFVRLLLMGGISKGCSRIASSRRSRAQLTIGLPL